MKSGDRFAPNLNSAETEVKLKEALATIDAIQYQV